ncbi:MAG: hypothetical protein M1813_003578 [Trichoglossum hirsutum]|nr:MAG: hypothetical protein M1813_003578 [Trichoglossum hirsutum]
MLFLTYIDLKDLVLDLILALQSLPVARLLPSPNGRRTLLSDLSRFNSTVDLGDFDLISAVPLLTKVLNKALDADIWDAVYSLVTQSTSPSRPLPYLDRTSISFNTSSLANTSKYRKYFDGALKGELDSSLYVDVSSFFDAFFSGVTVLQSLAEVVFKKFQKSEDPLYKVGGGWRSWPKEAPVMSQ